VQSISTYSDLLRGIPGTASGSTEQNLLIRRLSIQISPSTPVKLKISTEKYVLVSRGYNRLLVYLKLYFIIKANILNGYIFFVG
ncbi:hypothetical protein, partial [Oryzomonas rubra]|uniref:hypothetical protein n=1 Tax=Oryzomonas rubra TaxID=2509454 RepID=UPI001C3F5451